MKVAVFSTKKYDRELLDAANRVHGHDLSYFESHLGPATSRLAAGFPAVCVFVNDQVDSVTIKQLAAGGTRIIATRSTGFNHIDLKAAAAHNIKVVRVTDYSPYSVAEFAVGLLLTLNRKIHRAYNRTREGNFELDGLLGRDLHGRLQVMSNHLTKVGSSLDGAVSSYNKLVGSYEGRVLVAARKMAEMGVTHDDLASVSTIERTSRTVAGVAVAAVGGN